MTIRLDSTNWGTSTNLNGEFEMTLKMSKGHLIFSFIGFKTKRVAFTQGKFLSVTLEEEVTQMDEVVVNGMFTQNKNSYTGSVTTIKSEDILAVSNTNLLKAISILSPGLRIVEDNEAGSDPNHIPEIIIRGTTSIASQGEYGLNTPLIILDGVEISLSQLYDLDIYELNRIDVIKRCFCHFNLWREGCEWCHCNRADRRLQIGKFVCVIILYPDLNFLM